MGVLCKQCVEVGCIGCGYGWRIDDQDIFVVCLGVLREVVTAGGDHRITDDDLVVEEVVVARRGVRRRGRPTRMASTPARPDGHARTTRRTPSCGARSG